MLTRSYDVLEPYFCRYVLPGTDETSQDDSSIGGHGLLATQDAWEELVLNSLPSRAKDTVGKNLMEKWSDPREAKDLTAIEKWKTLLQHLRVKFGFPKSWPSPSSVAAKAESKPSSVKKPKTQTFSTANLDDETLEIYMWPMEFVFKYTYPRLDINVSKMQNHLLKSPFCVHPKTGRVCVPIDPNTMDNLDGNGGCFDPFSVPTLAQLARELDDYHRSEDSNEETGVVHDWEKTSLKGYFDIFKNNFLEPLEKEWRRKERDLAEQEAAIRVDF